MAFTRREKVNLYITITSIIAVIAIVGTIFWWMRAEFSEFKTYKNKRFGFEMSYPSEWEKSFKTPGTVVVFLSPRQGDLDIFRENVNVVVQDMSGRRQTLVEYSKTAINQIRVVFKQNLLIKESRLARFAGGDGYKLSYIGKGPQGDFKFLHYWTLRNGKAYQFTYAAHSEETFDYFLETVEKMAKSFEIK